MSSKLYPRFFRLTFTLWICGLFGNFCGPIGLASDFQSPRTLGLGGAGHANPMYTDAIYLNPSFIAITPVQALSVSYLSAVSGEVSDYSQYNFSFQDGLLNKAVQFGAGYTRKTNGSFLHLALSKGFAWEVSMGLGAKLFFPDSGGGSVKADGSFSASLILSEYLRIALLIDNLFESGVSQGLCREFVLGTKWKLSSFFQLYADPHYVPNVPSGVHTLGLEAGGEIPILSMLFLRGGVFKDSYVSYASLRGDGVGVGFGLSFPNLSIDYGYSRLTQPYSFGVNHFEVAFIF